MSSALPKVAGPWVARDGHSVYRADMRWPNDWAFGVWDCPDANGKPGWWWAKHRDVAGHVATKEEAMAAADAYGRAHGWTFQLTDAGVDATIGAGKDGGAE